MKLTATLDNDLSHQVRTVAEKSGVTPETVLQDAINLYINLSRILNRRGHSLAILDDNGVATSINDWITQMPANVIEFSRENETKLRQKNI